MTPINYCFKIAIAFLRVPFDKDELNAILKFGAEDIFKEPDKEGAGPGDRGDRDLQEMDIDDILSRAETQVSNEEASSHDDLLSQFKVASFAMDEDELDAPLATPTEGKPPLFSPGGSRRPVKPEKRELAWDEIIPEEVRARVEEEDRMKEQMKLYLPPRQRNVKVGRGFHCSLHVLRSWY